MPKKRHPTQFTKPPTTAPSALSSSSSHASTHDAKPSQPTVNDLLTTLRSTPSPSPRTDASTSDSTPAAALHTQQPTLPAPLRALLAIPESAPPKPRRRRRVDEFGRRLPAGPAPPRSWLGTSIYASREYKLQNAPAKGKQRGGSESEEQGWTRVQKLDHLPGISFPERKSLKALCLRTVARHWDEFHEFEKWNLALLPTDVRMLICSYVAVEPSARGGLEWGGLRTLLAPGGLEADMVDEFEGEGAGEENVRNEGLDEEETDWEAEADEVHFGGNEDFDRLDLAGSIGRGITLKQLTELVAGVASASKSAATPNTPNNKTNSTSSTSETPQPQLPRPIQLPLLPTLHHLSLALTSPFQRTASSSTPTSKPPISWPALLNLATHLPTLQSLSLAHWPCPTLTPNSTTTSIFSPNTSFPATSYSSTSYYAHTLDNDFSEAASILARLARKLYSLQHLDIDGCTNWAKALCWTPNAVSSYANAYYGAPPIIGPDFTHTWSAIRTISLKSGMTLNQQHQHQHQHQHQQPLSLSTTPAIIHPPPPDTTALTWNAEILHHKTTHFLARYLESWILKRRPGYISVLHDDDDADFAAYDHLWSAGNGEYENGKEAPSMRDVEERVLSRERRIQREEENADTWGDAGDYAEEALFWDALRPFRGSHGGAVDAVGAGAGAGAGVGGEGAGSGGAGSWGS